MTHGKHSNVRYDSINSNIISGYPENGYLAVLFILVGNLGWESGGSSEFVTFILETFRISHSYICSLWSYLWALALCEAPAVLSLGNTVVVHGPCLLGTYSLVRRTALKCDECIIGTLQGLMGAWSRSEGALVFNQVLVFLVID